VNYDEAKNGVKERRKKDLGFYLIERMKKMSEESGARFVILYLPTEKEIRYDQKKSYGQNYARQWFGEAKIPWVNPFPEIAAAHVKQPYEFRRGEHYGPLLNRDIARIFYEWLREHSWIPEDTSGVELK